MPGEEERREEERREEEERRGEEEERREEEEEEEEEERSRSMSMGNQWLKEEERRRSYQAIACFRKLAVREILLPMGEFFSRTGRSKLNKMIFQYGPFWKIPFPKTGYF